MLEHSFTQPNNILGPQTQQQVSSLGNIERADCVWLAFQQLAGRLLETGEPSPLRSSETPLKQLHLFPQAFHLNLFTIKRAECGSI